MVDYKLYKLEFQNGVRFGKGNLENAELTFHADTLFSALFMEALKLGMEREFLGYVRKNELLFSDAFPYKERRYYIPKPMRISGKFFERRIPGGRIKRRTKIWRT